MNVNSQHNQPKTLNQLMKHLREIHGIEIKGSKHKTLLRHYGYYHGYKGYRFFKEKKNEIFYTDFGQVIAVIEYDHKLKALFYPRLMFLEMALKNIVIDEIVKHIKNPSFDAVYAECMCDNGENTKLRLKRLKLKDKIHSTLSIRYSQSLSNDYSKRNRMISHYYNRGDEVPIWAIFEIITLGDFAELLGCLNEDIRKSIQESLMLQSGSDTGNQLLPNIIFTLKGLRNAVAHNNIVFDTRFKDRARNRNVSSWINEEVNIANIEFEHIADYVILMCCLLKKIGCDLSMLQEFVNEFRDAVDEAYASLPSEIYTKIISTDARGKLGQLMEYIKK